MMVVVSRRLGVTVLASFLVVTCVLSYTFYGTLSWNPAGVDVQAEAEDCHRWSSKEDFPKIIHQIWEKNQPIPEKWRNSVESCKAKNPGYAYKLWTMDQLEELIEREFTWFNATFMEYPYVIQRADAIRYFLLYKYGGFYIDLDITCKVPFDDMIPQIPDDANTIVAYQPWPGTLDISVFISKRDNPFMKAAMHKLQSMNHWFLMPFLTVYFSTGPFFCLTTYHQYPCRNTVYIMTKEESRTLYFNHMQSGSWHKRDYFIVMIYHFVSSFKMVVLLLVIFAFVLVRKWKASRIARREDSATTLLLNGKV